MKFVKKLVLIVIGLLAVLFVGAHIKEIPDMIRAEAGDLQFVVKASAILLGSAVAIKCFKSASRSETA
jgi:hypothetical protein